MSISAAQVNANNELRERIRNLTTRYYDQNLYAAKTRERIVRDIAVIRDELVDKLQISLPVVALYVADYGATLKAQFHAPSLLKGDGCVGWLQEKKGGDIANFHIANTGQPRQ